MVQFLSFLFTYTPAVGQTYHLFNAKKINLRIRHERGTRLRQIGTNEPKSDPGEGYIYIFFDFQVTVHRDKFL